MKILFGVDGSDGSLNAIRQTSAMTSPDHDSLVFYYAPPEMNFPSGEEAAARSATSKKLLADAVFAKALECVPDALRGGVQTIVGTREPKTGILLAAAESRADVVVLGARGSGPVAAIKLGGVARHVARAANIPVMIVRPRTRSEGEPLRILLATDGSEASEQAGASLRHVHWPASAEGFVMTVVEPLLSPTIPDWLLKQARDPETEAMAANWAKEHEANKNQTRVALAAYAKTLAAPFHAHEPIVAEGHPAEQILKTINEKKIDLVVVGAQGKNAWQRFMIGSTSETLLAQAPCSVLLVRRREKP